MNTLVKTLVYDNQVSLSVMDTTELVNKAIQTHNLKGGAAKTLGELLTGVVYMSGCLKSEKGAVSITIKGTEEVGTVSVSGDVDLHIRGYIDSLQDGRLKGGSMTVIKDDGFYRPYVGAIDLPCDKVSEDLMQYFHQSEQIPTAIAIGVELDENDHCTVAGGVVMQLLPGTSDENMDKAENVMQNFVDVCSVLKELGVDGIMDKFFGDETESAFVYRSYPAYQCNCSKNKIVQVLKSVTKAELLDICKEQGCVSVHCHYCNTDYKFYEEDVETLF